MEKTESKVKTALETITEVGLKFYGNRYYTVEFTTLHVIKLMESYAAQQVALAIAEKDKEIAELENWKKDSTDKLVECGQDIGIQSLEIERLKEGLREIQKLVDLTNSGATRYSRLTQASTIASNLLKPPTA